MKRIIVDYKKLTPQILNLLVEKYPDGYGVRDIIKFTNPKGVYIEAVEVSTDDTVYLVKISDKLANTMDNFDEDLDNYGLENNLNEDIDVDNVNLDDD